MRRPSDCGGSPVYLDPFDRTRLRVTFWGGYFLGVLRTMLALGLLMAFCVSP